MIIISYVRYLKYDITSIIIESMGGSASINYSVPVNQKPEGESAIYRNPYTKDKLYDSPSPGLNTMKIILLNSLKQHSNRPAMGNCFMIQEQLSREITNLK